MPCIVIGVLSDFYWFSIFKEISNALPVFRRNRNKKK